MDTKFIRVGRIVLNLGEIVKVVRDGRTREVTVTMKDGTTTTFTKHAQAFWLYMKQNSVAQIVGSADDLDDQGGASAI